MEAITELTQIDFSYIFISVLSILIGIKAIVSLLEWGIEKLGIETKITRRRREDHELLMKIARDLADMQRKIDHTEMAKLKNQILSYYKKYKDVGEWNKFESEVFWSLYDSYISHGGNSFVERDIEPVMRNLREIDSI